MNIDRMAVDHRWYRQIHAFVKYLDPRHRLYMPNGFYSIEHVIRGQALGPDNDAPEVFRWT